MSSRFEKIAVIGAGAIGLYYGGRLAAAGRDVRFLLRSDFDEISRNGLRVKSVHGDFELPTVSRFRSVEEIGPVDLVIVAWKSTANDRLAEVLPPLLHEETRVLTLQNGLGNCETIETIVGEGKVLGGLCFVCINRISAGVVSHTAGGKISLGGWGGGRPDEVEEVISLLKTAGIPAVAAENLERAQWEKLVWNIPFNGLAVAEGGVTTDVLLSDPEIEAEIRGLMEEVVAAARSIGIPLGDDLVDSNIERTRPMGPYKPSTMIDFVEGREIELKAIWEEPLRRAKAAGVEMPRLESLIERIRAITTS